MPRGFYGRPRGARDGVRNWAGELEGCMGVKIGNFRCSCGCLMATAVIIAVAAAVVLVLKFGYHMF